MADVVHFTHRVAGKVMRSMVHGGPGLGCQCQCHLCYMGYGLHCSDSIFKGILALQNRVRVCTRAGGELGVGIEALFVSAGICRIHQMLPGNTADSVFSRRLSLA